MEILKRPLYFLCGELPDQYCSDLLFVVCFIWKLLGGACDDHVPAFIGSTRYDNADPDKRILPFYPKGTPCGAGIIKEDHKDRSSGGTPVHDVLISNILIQANINGYGTNTIASWAVYGKIDGIFWMTMDAMGISCDDFAGQNFGAGKIKRLKKGTYVGLLMSTIITAALGVFMFTAGPVLISLFTNDVDVMAESMSISASWCRSGSATSASTYIRVRCAAWAMPRSQC